MSKQHTYKMIAPIIITVFMVLYWTVFFLLMLWLKPPVLIIIIGAVILIGLSGILIAMMVERIKEIRSGEEDDLSKY